MPAHRASSSGFSRSRRCAAAAAIDQRSDRRDRRAAAAARDRARRTKTLIDRRYDAKEVPDVATAMRTAGAWLQSEQKLHLRRDRASRRAWRAGLRPADAGEREGARRSRALCPACAAAPAQQSRADPHPAAALSATAAGRLLRHRLSPRPQRRRRPLRHSGTALCGRRPALRLSRPVLRICRRPPARARSRSRQWAGHRRASRQRRLDVRDREWPQRRKHDGLHRARRAADGHAARPDRSRRRALSA